MPLDDNHGQPSGGRTMFDWNRPSMMLLALLALLLLPMPAAADGPQTGTIDGQVVDAQGQALPGVTVNLAGPQGEKTTVTDDEGRYRFALLQAGRYTVGASLEGLGSTELS